jgi:putative transcriptional regulator
MDEGVGDPHEGPDGSLSGRLLVATPMLRDPNFDRTVVLVLEHSELGALGVILNRPGATSVGDVLPAWGRLAAHPDVVFQGGPVQPGGVIGLFELAAEDASDGPDGWRSVLGRVGAVDLERDADAIPTEAGRLRLFAGYAGWGPGQLDGEVALAAWWVLDCEPTDALSDRPDELWQTVLARQEGRLAWMANYPDDPAVN